MRYIFKFPDIGEGISEGKILQWYVKKGQEVKSGDSLVKMETDKVVTDIPSPKSGVIVNLFGKEGEVIQVDSPLVEIEIEGITPEEMQVIAQEKPKPIEKKPIEEKGFGVVGTLEVAGDSSFLPAGDEGVHEEKAKPEPEAEMKGKEKEEERPARRALATPVARAMAKDLGVDINTIRGTGPGGRVTKRDIQGHHEAMQSGKPSGKVPPGGAREEVAAGPQEPRVVYQPLSQIRKTIARNMLRSKQSTAHMTVIEEVEVSELVYIREKYKGSYSDKGLRLSYLPFILKAVARSLKLHPLLNSEMDMEHERMIVKNYYNIGIAVDTPDGLVVPVIRDIDKISISDLSFKIMDISQRARDRKLSLEDFKDGTFTVTNYGSIGGTFGVPVINYPQAAILGVGRIMKTPVVNEDDEIVVGHVLPLSMSVDHRIVDGAEAARFISTVMGYLKDPVSLLLF